MWNLNVIKFIPFGSGIPKLKHLTLWLRFTHFKDGTMIYVCLPVCNDVCEVVLYDIWCDIIWDVMCPDVIGYMTWYMIRDLWYDMWHDTWQNRKYLIWHGIIYEIYDMIYDVTSCCITYDVTFLVYHINRGRWFWS